MSAAAWRWALASVAGTSHVRVGAACQDASACRVVEGADGEGVLIAVASDGAGSAARAAAGAEAACRTLLEEVASFCAEDGDLPERLDSLARRWVRRFHAEVACMAKAAGLARRDFACTALAALVGSDWAAFLQIGDGAMVISLRDEPDDFAWVFWPERGEYANQTSFLTDRTARAHLRTTAIFAPVDAVALFTDGVQALALHYETRAAHAPFFGPIFAAVGSDGAAEPGGLSGALAGFLDSPAVNSRADDDKTLVVAVRGRQLRPAALDDAADDDGAPR